MADLEVPRNPQSRRFDLGVMALVIGTVLYRLSKTIADPDLWGHVKFGEDLWKTGEIIRRDPYSYLSGDQPWINHEWLAEAIFYLAFAKAGSEGLIVLKVAVGLLIVGLLYRHLCCQGLTPLRAGIVLLGTHLLLVAGLETVRPQVFTYLFFLLTLLLIHHAERSQGRWLWAAPPVFALWANLHGGFLAGLAILLLWSVVHVLSSAGRARDSSSRPTSGRAFVLVAVASVFATFLNPYGAQLWILLLRTAAVPRPFITEWQPIVLMSSYGVTYLAVLGFAVAGLVYTRRERSPALILLFVCAALLPLMSIRHTPLFAIAVAVLAGEHLGDSWERWASSHGASASAGGDLRLQRWLTLPSLAGALLMIGFALERFDCIGVDSSPEGGYPAGAVALLKHTRASGNLAVHFDWGEYVLWHLGPGIKVSIDGRRETVYTDKVDRMNLDFYFGVRDWDALLRERQTQLALVNRKYPVYNLLRLAPDWLLIYEDSVSGLFVRAGSPIIEPLRAVQPSMLPNGGADRCFP